MIPETQVFETQKGSYIAFLNKEEPVFVFNVRTKQVDHEMRKLTGEEFAKQYFDKVDRPSERKVTSLQKYKEKGKNLSDLKLNEYIARNEALEWGKLRTGTVGISGTDYEPPVPEKKKVVNELNDILNDTNTSATDKALKTFIWGTRGQFFWDGNKRTSLLLSNKILLSAGAGIMTITDKYMEQFNFLLLNYYNTGAAEKLKQFLYENAIQGMKI